MNALHGVLPALDAGARLGGGCQALDDLSDLALELVHLVDILVVHRGDEDETLWRVSGVY